jgi:hypothetical protein
MAKLIAVVLCLAILAAAANGEDAFHFKALSAVSSKPLDVLDCACKTLRSA